MNKVLLLVTTSLFITIMSLTAGADQNFLFLSYDQFSDLTPGEQKQYIDSVQVLVTSFDERNGFSKSGLLFREFFKAASAADDQTGSSQIRSPDIRVENAKIDHVFDTLDNFIKSARDFNSPVLRSSVKDTFINTHNRIQDLSQKNLSPEQRRIFEKNLLQLQERFGPASQLVPELKTMNLKMLNVKMINPISATPKANTEVSAKVKVASEKPKPTMASQPARCLYAGFVIKAENCTPTKVLEDRLRLQELGNSEFKCKTNSEILCNPLVFGYQSDLSPYCTTRSKSASKNCQEASNNVENLVRIHAAWKNPANKKVYEDFQKSLQQLCDDDNKNSDVKMTCKVVVAQFNEKVKKEFPAHMTPQKIESLMKDKSSVKR